MLTGRKRPSNEAAPGSMLEETRALARLAGPLVGANLLQMAVAAVDVIFVARLGTVEFAAATLGVFMFSLLLYAVIVLCGAVAPIIAAELGRRAHAVREVRRSFRMALWLCLIAATPCALALAHGETILLLMGQDPVVSRRAGVFLDILAFALFPGVVAGVMRTAAAAIGRPGWTFVVTAVALAFAILGNWCLVFGNAGFPAMGLEGSAIVTVATMTLMMLSYAVILLIDRRLRRFHLFGRWWRSEWPRFRQIARIGVPMALTWVFESAMFGGAAILMGLIGVNEVAAHAVALNIAAVAFQLPMGIAQAATIRVGLAYGARNHAWIARAGNVALVAGIGCMVLTAALIWATPRLFIGAYIDVNAPANAIVVGLAAQYLAIAAMFQIVDGAQAVAAGVLRGLQDTRIPMVIAAFGYWAIGFATSVVLGFPLGWRGVGIWVGLAAGLAVVALLLLWRWRARDRIGLLPA